MEDMTLITLVLGMMYAYPKTMIGLMLFVVMYAYYKWVMEPIPGRIDHAPRHVFNGRTPYPD